jgi:hypothetical protein
VKMVLGWLGIEETILGFSVVELVAFGMKS